MDVELTGFVKGVSELALWVADLDRAIAFYRDKLGFAVEEVDTGKNAFLRSGSLILALFWREDPGSQLGREYLARTGGPQGEVYHVGFMVEPQELDEAASALRKRGLDVKGPIEFATGRRSYVLEDTDEHYIELTDR